MHIVFFFSLFFLFSTFTLLRIKINEFRKNFLKINIKVCKLRANQYFFPRFFSSQPKGVTVVVHKSKDSDFKLPMGVKTVSILYFVYGGLAIIIGIIRASNRQGGKPLRKKCCFYHLCTLVLFLETKRLIKVKEHQTRKVHKQNCTMIF